MRYVTGAELQRDHPLLLTILLIRAHNSFQHQTNRLPIIIENRPNRLQNIIENHASRLPNVIENTTSQLLHRIQNRTRRLPSITENRTTVDIRTHWKLAPWNIEKCQMPNSLEYGTIYISTVDYRTILLPNAFDCRTLSTNVLSNNDIKPFTYFFWLQSITERRMLRSVRKSFPYFK